MDDTISVLARTLWGEARGEGRGGMEAVASVILNRAAHPRWWGRDIRGVCLAKNQFSCWLPEPVGQLNRMRGVTIADPYFKLALAVAQQAMSGDLIDQTNGADSYANLHVCSPAWARGAKPSAVIGNHTFFRLEIGAPTAARTAPTPAPQPQESEADKLNDASLQRGRSED